MARKEQHEIWSLNEGTGQLIIACGNYSKPISILDLKQMGTLFDMEE